MNEETKAAQTDGAAGENLLLSLHLSDLWRGVEKFWILCLALIVVCAGGVAFLVGRRYTPIYECTATFTVDTQAGQGYSLDAYGYYYNRITASQLAETFPFLLRSSILQDKICAKLGMDYLPGSIDASALSGTNLFTLRVRANTAENAYAILDAVTTEYPQVAEYVIGATKLRILSEPVMPQSPINTLSYPRQLVKGAAVGVLLSAAWLVLYALSRKTVRTKEDIRGVLHTDCVGILPRVRFRKYRREVDTTILLNNPIIGAGFVESLRALRNTVLHVLSDKEKVVMVTSTAPGEGKTTVTVNLAASLAAVHKRVLLIDADLRNPSVCATLDPNGTCAAEADGSAANLPEHVTVRRYTEYGVSVMTFDEGMKLWSAINAQWLRKLVERVRPAYDYILIDTPPCGLLTDASIVADAADAVLFVVDQDGVRTTRIRAAMDTVRSKSARFLGCVLNNAASGLAGYGSNYGYGYSRYGRYGKYGKYGAYGRELRDMSTANRYGSYQSDAPDTNEKSSRD